MKYSYYIAIVFGGAGFILGGNIAKDYVIDKIQDTVKETIEEVVLNQSDELAQIAVDKFIDNINPWS